MEHADTFAENKLMQYLHEIRNTSAGRYSIHFRISRLKPYNRKHSQPEELKNNLKIALGNIGANVFTLGNGDLICIISDVSMINLERIVSRFKKTLAHDPLLQSGMDTEEFYQVYDLGRENREFCEMLAEIAREYRQYPTGFNMTPDDEQLLVCEFTMEDGIDAKTLALIQNVVKHADASNLLRRQAICWIEGDMIPHPMHYQYSLSLQVLQDVLHISESMTGNIWTFKQLTAFLDKMMLNLTKDIFAQKSVSSVFLNMNLRTLATPFFKEFIQGFRRKKDMTLEIDILDIIAHPEALSHAQELAQKIGFKLCINGINRSNFHYINPKSFEDDQLVKVSAPFKNNERNALMSDWIKAVNPIRVILHHCDEGLDIQLGIDMGMNYFQGHGVDALLRKHPPTR